MQTDQSSLGALWNAKDPMCLQAEREDYGQSAQSTQADPNPRWSYMSRRTVSQAAVKYPMI